ncbi:hypothetical protein B0A52_09140 [Exophiala mesophila]|uniref:JmjC domain-containing histone demethylation protein 1 n=1 Tax=Exophiala mesophila TaxID=212818 RepID=A0A438MUH3_EXOME|nr:hypothetical protein B0A52_09140 [Exophiala mesophila]
MTTSTRWRTSEEPRRPRMTSPERPQPHDIERISPEPGSQPPPVSEPLLQSDRSSTEDKQQQLKGLGLPTTVFSDHLRPAVQPDHLYIDSNGSAHIAAKVLDPVSTRPQTSPFRLPPEDTSISRYPQNRSKPSHTRSGSTIDDLATVAIASPAPRHSHPPSPAPDQSHHIPTQTSDPKNQNTPYLESSDGPPAKRIKSENIPPPPERPNVTVVDAPNEISREEAFLLLGLKFEVNFKKETPRLPSAAIHVDNTAPSRLLEAWGQQPNTPTGRPGLDTQDSYNNISHHRSKRPRTAEDTHRDISDLSGSRRASFSGQHDSWKQNLPRSPGFAEHHSRFQEGDSHTDLQQPPTKKQRRVQTEVVADVCAACRRVQIDNPLNDEGTTNWIECDGCKRWFHGDCVGLRTKADVDSVDKYRCRDCEPVHGKTTYVRKSSRARTAIDYARLNQGLVTSAVESSTHPYIQPFKEGKIKLVPDDFARIRPELVTADLLENFDGMKRPFVVPAAWNPRFGVQLSPDSDGALLPDPNAKPELRLDGNGQCDTYDPSGAPEMSAELVMNCGQDLLDMVIPENLTVRRVAELYGLDEPVPVIDVKSQETKGHFTLQQWADYYEQPGEKPIRNVISLEVSHSALGKLIRRPKVVRDLDLEDHVWDTDTEARTKKKPVQFYCLMSVADSYTDFHIDFGGSSVYYHILKGTKTFFFIPPEDRYLKKYEDWCNSDTQGETWLGDLCNDHCIRVDLHEGDTAFIPAGWIHSVWTPEDSLVIGGNFLTRIDYEMQLKVVNVEKLTKVAAKFRYPYFQKVMWYALIKYLEEDPVPEDVMEDFRQYPDHTFLRANPVWHEFDDLINTAEPGDEYYNARFYSKSEISGLPALRDYLYRTARIDAGLPVADITKKQIDAVKASVPKGHGDPLTLIKMFAIWCAWKKGNETVPEWVYSDGALEVEMVEKVKKAETFRLPGERSSSRKAAQAATQTRNSPVVEIPAAPPKSSNKSTPRGSGLRVACATCRQRRIKCRHKPGSETPSRAAPEIRPRSFSNAERGSSASGNLNGANGDMSSPETRNLEPIHGLDTTVPMSGEAANGVMQTSSKKSRSKACEECRKSKRRCVHDEHGRLDPAKAAEPSRPRGSTNSKRPGRLSDETVQSRNEDDNMGDLDDPEMHNEAYRRAASEAIEDEPSPPCYNGASREGTKFSESGAAANLQLIKELDADHVTTTNLSDNIGIKREADGSDILRTPVATRTTGELATPSTIRMDTGMKETSPPSRYSSRQAKPVERYTPEEAKTPSKTAVRSKASPLRNSSEASGQTAVTSVKSRRSSSNTSGTTHQIAGGALRHNMAHENPAIRLNSVGSDAGADSDMDADEKFARELQAAELGLRRRASMRA